MHQATELFGDDDVLMAGYRYWTGLTGENDVPRASKIDPINIPASIFPNVVLANYLDDEPGVHFRIIGQNMVDRWGSSFSGKTSRDVFSGSYRDFLENAFEQARVHRCPIYSESAFRWDKRGASLTRRLMMPFADDALEKITRVIVVQVWPGGVTHDRDTFSHVVSSPTSDFKHSIPKCVVGLPAA